MSVRSSSLTALTISESPCCSSSRAPCCGAQSLWRSARTACAGMSPSVDTTRRNNSDENEIHRSQVREAGTRKKPSSCSALVWIVRRCASSANGSPSVASSSTKKRIVSVSSSYRSNRAAKPICTARSVCCASGAALRVLAFGSNHFSTPRSGLNQEEWWCGSLGVKPVTVAMHKMRAVSFGALP